MAQPTFSMTEPKRIEGHDLMPVEIPLPRARRNHCFPRGQRRSGFGPRLEQCDTLTTPERLECGTAAPR